MATLTQQAQGIIAAFATQPGVTQDQVGNLLTVINSSPVLVDQFNLAVEQRHLRQIVPLANPNAGGEYDPQNHAMRLPLARLTTTPGGQLPTAGEVAFVLGHELQHGFNAADSMRALTDFRGAVGEIAGGNSPPRDYTAPLGELLAQNRRDEAGAEVAGWNAIVSRVKSANPNPTLGEIYREQPGRMADFIDVTRNGVGLSYTLKPNLALNADLTLNPTQSNLEAMGQNYFDKPARNPGGLGALGNSDYANYYAVNPISHIAQVERSRHPSQPGDNTPQMTLNLSRLHLRESLLEENGLNLGGNTQPLPYLDNSTHPPTAGLLQHTIDTHRHVAPVANQLPEVEPAFRHGGTPDHSYDPTQPEHPDHALLEQIRTGMRKVDADLGKAYDDDSERLSRSLLAACKDNRDMYPGKADYSLAGNALDRVDHVVLGKTGNLIAVQGTLDDPAMKRAIVPVEQALATPVEQSDQKLALANQALAQEQQRTAQQELSRDMDAPSRAVPGR